MTSELYVLGLFTLSVCTRVFVMAEVFNGGSVHITNNPAIAFLSIELERCGFVSWCTINVTMVQTRLGTCCQGCPCDPRCELSNSCCPDYEFGKQTDWRTYTALPDFVDAFLNWTANTSDNDNRRTSETSTRLTNEVRGQCLRAQVRHVCKYREDVDTFYMSSECPPSDNFDTIRKTRCELDYYTYVDRREPEVKLSFEDLVPVTSQEGQIYKNSHCLACRSAVNGSSSVWTVSVLCHSEQMVAPYYEHFVNPNILLEAIVFSDNRLKSCNIIFEPNQNHSATVNSHRCTRFDFDRCPDSTGTDSDICSRYVSPVYEYSGPDRTRVIYKNAACIACRENATDFVNNCHTLHDSRRLKMRLNVPREMAGLDVTEHVDDLLHVRFPGDPQHGCRAGEVYDRLTDVCRKMYCPKGMFAFRGECQSFFQQVEGGVFSVILRLAPTSPFPSFTDVAAAIYDKTRIMAEKNHLVAIKSLAVWCSETNKFLLTLDFTVDHTEGTFSDAIKFTESLVKTAWSINSTAAVTVFQVALADSASRAFRKYIDVRNGDTYVPVYPLTPGTGKRDCSTLQITEDNFCYRVLLNKDEYVLTQTKDTILIKSSGKPVFHTTPTYNDLQLAKLLVCTEHIVDYIPNMKKVNNIEHGITKPNLDEPSESESAMKTAVAPLLLALTAVLVVGTCVTRHRLAQRAIQDSTPADP